MKEGCKNFKYSHIWMVSSPKMYKLKIGSTNNEKVDLAVRQKRKKKDNKGAQ